MTETENNINNHINAFTAEAIQQRGLKLYAKGAVNFKVYNDATDTWKFFVQGTQQYRVTIQGINSNNIEATCTCPYSWGGICKHTVASLLFIADYKKQAESPQLTSKTENKGSDIRKSSENGLRLELTDYELITQEFVSENVSERINTLLNYYTNFIKFNGIEFNKSSIVFNMEKDGVEIKVKIHSEKSKVYISSSENVQIGQLSLSAGYCLKMIANSETSDMLGNFFSDNWQNKQKELLKIYGLSEKADFNEYFNYAFNEYKGLFIKRTKKSIGLVPVFNDKLDPIMRFINKTSSNEIVLDGLSVNKQKRNIGFVLKLKGDDYYNDYNTDSLSTENNLGDYEIIAIIAKSNKSGTLLNSNFEKFEGSALYQINKSENTKELLDTIDKIKGDTDAPTEFQHKKKAFKLLLNEKFVFTLKKDKYSIKKSNLEKISLSPINLDIVFEISEDSSFISSELKIKIGDNLLNFNNIDTSKSSNDICVINNVFYFAKNYKVSQYIANYPGILKMVSSYKDNFFKQILHPISKDFQVIFKNNPFKLKSVELDFNKKQVFLSEKNEYIIITPQVEYDNGISALLHSTGNILIKNDNNILEYIRNHELEDDYIERLADLHPKFESQKSRRVFYLHFSEFAENMWFYKFFDKLKADNIEVYGLKDLKNFKYSPYKGKISTSVSSGQDWFELDVAVSFGDNKVSLSDIRKAVINKQRYIQLNDGSVGVLPSEWFVKLEKYFRIGEIKDDKLAISKLRFSIIDELFDNIDDLELLHEISEKRKKLASFTEISKTEIPAEITGELRPYQKEGLNWLNFLDEMQWGGILADDMGLGKTLQILTFIQYMINKKASTNLIIVPTTLMFNWENEIAKFAPKLKAFYHYGPDRQKNTDDFDKYHIVFTTYGVLLRDIEMLHKFRFNYVILDESQAIKNPASRRYKAANLLNTNNRIALSGTPIENGTFDLFAQMSFANKGFFNSAKAFKDNYSNPIDKDGNETIAMELQKLINPFILRRTKENVATELPAKTEDIIYCEMESEQRQIYDAYRNNYKNQLLNKIEDEGMGKSKLMVLEALTRLRQICDSPALVNKDHITDAQSIKVKEILRHITNKTANHKILIFSQFVKMLSIIKSELAKQNIDYEYLDGRSSTKQRKNSVNNFQDNDDLRVFLISLKAGGTGLNLTAADYVYIIDPWWNPAVENQAIDRCYRIGQNKKVFAYRMICTNTVEEKIIKLQNKKKKIAGDIIQTDENIMKTLDTDDIKDLFS